MDSSPVRRQGEPIDGGAPAPTRIVKADMTLSHVTDTSFTPQAQSVRQDAAEQGEFNPSPLSFSTKATTLISLRGRLKTATVLPAFVVDAESWHRDRDAVFDRIAGLEELSGELLVRSSARDEDASGASLAGKFLSCRAVNQRASVLDAIARVFASYGAISGSDQVLIQPYLHSTRMSGVAFNRDPNTHAEYDTINYTLSSDTAFVTSGRGGNPQGYIASRWSSRAAREPFDRVIALLRELEQHFGAVPIDIEFAIGREGDLVLLQARAMPAAPASALGSIDQRTVIEEASRAVARILAPQPDVLGERTLLGIMPDWNPAEIIGVRPRPLAFSLYRLLITDNVWAHYRHKYGYRDTRSVPLMVSLHGLPYIDVRASFNSFLPAVLPDDIACRLVNACIEHLAANPHLHDKVEFEVVPSCYTPQTRRKLETLGGLSLDDRAAITNSLHRLTNDFIVGKAHRQIEADKKKIDLLRQRQAMAARPDAALVTRLHRVVADCRRFGSGPFSGLARVAFVATDMLRAAVAEGVVDEAESYALFNSLDTPTSRLMDDLVHLDRESLVEKYGHLRPGTYDIRVPSYAEAPDTYLDTPSIREERKRHAWAPAPRTRKLLDHLLAAHDIQADSNRFFEFVAESTVAREDAKFVFTRSLSTALNLIAQIGELHGFSREQMSYVDVRDLLDLRVHTWDIEEALSRSIEIGYKRSRLTSSLLLPALIRDPDDLWCFEVLASRPNFVTRRVAEGPVRFAADTPLQGSIVLIPNADPGFDWLFAKGIVGLVTAYGGSNSHMAVRAVELRLPAVIGAGDTLFNTWSGARRLRIDCGIERVEIVA